MIKLILGSGSPRRKEILGYFSLPFDQVSSDYDEEALEFEGDPALYASHLALGKAEKLAPRFPEEAILTADTVVFKDGKIFNKPKDEEEAFQILSELTGAWHTILGHGFAFSPSGILPSGSDTHAF